MLRQTGATELTYNQQTVQPHAAVRILCDDGQWHPGVVHAWHRRGTEWDVLVYYYSGGHHFGDWVVYRPAAMRSAEDESG